MTPDRLERQQLKWGALLNSELSWLEGEQYEENKFVISAFVGQGRRPARKKREGGVFTGRKTDLREEKDGRGTS
jgi:hypothetical protein